MTESFDLKDTDEQEGSTSETVEAETSRRSGIAYVAGLSIFFSVLSFLGVGWLLDRWLETSPWMMVGGVVLGSAIGFYEFIRIVSKIK